MTTARRQDPSLIHGIESLKGSISLCHALLSEEGNSSASSSSNLLTIFPNYPHLTQICFHFLPFAQSFSDLQLTDEQHHHINCSFLGNQSKNEHRGFSDILTTVLQFEIHTEEEWMPVTKKNKHSSPLRSWGLVCAATAWPQ